MANPPPGKGTAHKAETISFQPNNTQWALLFESLSMTVGYLTRGSAVERARIPEFTALMNLIGPRVIARAATAAAGSG
jgi:hypothetical protein